MTAHEFARQLLAMEDLPIFHFDPSLAGYDDERDTSTSEPRADLVEVPAEGERCNDPDQVDRFITIGGTDEGQLEDEETREKEHDRMHAVLNTPETADFIKGVPLEAAHQRIRWGDEHVEDKSGAQWAFLFGVLAGKAIQAAKSGNTEKARHHAITAAAAMANFHRLVSGGYQPPDGNEP